MKQSLRILCLLCLLPLVAAAYITIGPVTGGAGGGNNFNPANFTTNGSSQVDLANGLATASIVTNNPEALAFILSQGITDVLTKRDVNEAVSEMKNGGYWSNAVSIIGFEPRLGKIAPLVGPAATLLGTSNQINFGLICSQTSTGLVSLPTMTNYTVLVSWKALDTDLRLGQGQGAFLALLTMNNTNSGSKNGIGYINTAQGLSVVSETNAGVLTTFTAPQVYNVDVASTQPTFPTCEQVCSALVVSNNNDFIWSDGRPCVFAGPVQSVITSTDVVNQLELAGLTNSATRAFSGQIASIAVFNFAMSQTQISSATKALAWLDYSTTAIEVGGDSRLAQTIWQNGGLNYFYDTLTLFSQQNPDVRVINRSRSGATTANLINNTVTGTAWDWREITNLPAAKYLYREAQTDFGINDLYINSATAATIETNIFVNLAPVKASGVSVAFWGIYDVAYTNANWVYSTNNLLAQSAINTLFYYSPFFNSFYPCENAVTQFELNSNNPAKYTVDGVHVSGVTATNPAFGLVFAGMMTVKGKPLSVNDNTNLVNYFVGQVSWSGTNNAVQNQVMPNTSIIANSFTGNGFVSTATNTVFAASSTGFTNGAGDLILCGVTGVGITRTNILSGQGFSYGTLTTPTDIFLTKSNQLRATSGFNVLGFQSH